MSDEHDVTRAAAARLGKAVSDDEPVVALTGAGVSAESGIPTFRGPGGLWKGFRPEELATPDAFRRDPETVWEWYHWRRRLVLEAAPNPAHEALATLEKAHRRFTLVTQNVDRLHQRAGSESVLELHGNLHEVRCTRCSVVAPLNPDADGIVSCETCGGLGRPHIVWFGEMLPEAPWQRAYAAATEAAVLLVIGTSAAVYPAAGLVELAARGGADVIEINPAETALSPQATWTIRQPAGVALPRMLSQAGIA